MTGRAKRTIRTRRHYSDELPESIRPKAIIILIASLCLAMPVAGNSVARPAQQSVLPDLHITRVRRLEAFGLAATAEIEVRWTAQVPRLTTIDGFDAGLEVAYSDGSKNSFSNSLRASARTAIFKVPSHPRQGSSAELKRFKASLKVNFKVASTVALTQEFAVEPQTGRLTLRSGRVGEGRAEISIAEARLTSKGCASDQQCIDVKWTASALRNLSFGNFELKADSLHKDGTRRSASTTAAGNQRQARLPLDSTGSDVASVRISLLADLLSSDSRTTIQEGAF